MKLKAIFLAASNSSSFYDLLHYAGRECIPVYSHTKRYKNKDIPVQVLPALEPINFLSTMLKRRIRNPIALIAEFPKKSLPLRIYEDHSLSAVLERNNFDTINLIRYGIAHHSKLLLITDPLQLPPLMACLAEKRLLGPLQERLALEAWETLKQYEHPNAMEETISAVNGGNLTGGILVDLHLALEYVRELREPGIVLIDHTKRCGIAEGNNLKEAFLKLLSSFSRASSWQNTGVISKPLVAVNRPVDQELAHLLITHGIGTVVAPAYEMEALMLLHTTPVKLLILRRSAPPVSWGRTFGEEAGTALVDDLELITSLAGSLKVVSRRFPYPEEWRDMLFSWKLIRRSPTAGVMVVKEQKVYGLGSGQINCLHDVTVALEQAAQEAQGAAIAFRNFVPFKDGVALAGQFGIKAIIQPGGSVRDEEVISVADCYDIAMVFASSGLSRLGPPTHE